MVDVIYAAFHGALLRCTFELCGARQPSELGPEMLDNFITTPRDPSSMCRVLRTTDDHAESFDPREIARRTLAGVIAGTYIS